MKLTYVGPHDQVEIPDLGILCKHGETIDVPPEVAGRAPDTSTDDDGNEVVDDPGEGLLAQPGNWLPPRRKDAQTAAGQAKKRARQQRGQPEPVAPEDQTPPGPEDVDTTPSIGAPDSTDGTDDDLKQEDD